MLQSLNPGASQYPERMTFPATLGRRFAALMIDWMLVAYPIMMLVTPARHANLSPDEATRVFVESSLVQLLVLILNLLIMTSLVGGSIGQLVLKLRVIDEHTGGRPSMAQVVIRTILLLLVLPAVFAKDGRGYHDVLARTQIVKIAAA